MVILHSCIYSYNNLCNFIWNILLKKKLLVNSKFAFCEQIFLYKQETIGFIGLGNMGGPMAKNLLDAGHKLVVHDVFREAVVDLKELGAATAATPREIASTASTIITMLPSR